MLVKRDCTSKLAMNNPESCSITSLANSKLFLMVNLVVIGSGYGIIIADEIGQKGA